MVKIRFVGFVQTTFNSIALESGEFNFVFDTTPIYIYMQVWDQTRMTYI